MNKCVEINIKETMPSVDVALDDLKGAIKIKKSLGYKCLVVIHGYGSTGKGGAICKKARDWLKSQKKSKKLKSVIPGEEFDVFNEKNIALLSRYSELKNYICKCNHGVTIVEL